MKTRDYAAALLALALLGHTVAQAQTLNTIGVSALRAVTTNLNGANVSVAQVEADYGVAGDWEVSPGSVGQPVGLFTYTSSSGSATGFPNAVGAESSHADSVAGYFYGRSGGVATNVVHVDNFEASYFAQQSGFLGTYSVTLPASDVNDPVVNQSFIFANSDYSHYPVGWEQTIDSQYDNYAAQYNTLFVSGAGNGGPTNQSRVYPPATCYNGLGVAAFGGSSCTGPTLDNGRAKPDITAPGSETSWSTPQVAGAAALLMQAGWRGDGGGDTVSATDIRTVKALLLNGAVKPSDWTNDPPSPLDPRYGAGVLNVFNSYEQLAGGQHGFTVATTASSGGAHPPTGVAGTISALSGWDFNTNTSGSIPHPFDSINHYYFDVNNADSNATFTATATLVWERHQNQTGINNLALFLYNAANSNLVAASTSVVDNVQHVFVPRLAQGRYDLQVWKAGGIGIVSTAEPYALAWAFTSERLNASKSGASLNLSWPVYPDGFHLEATANLTAPDWKTNNLPPPVFTNDQNVVVIGLTNTAQFFRLRPP